VPGLNLALNVLDGQLVYVATDGGIDSDTDDATVEVQLFVDGIALAGAHQLVECVTSQEVFAWSFSLLVPLTTGEHDLHVAVRSVDGANIEAGGTSSDPKTAHLTVLVLNQ
jgi:hypothetical protein